MPADVNTYIPPITILSTANAASKPKAKLNISLININISHCNNIENIDFLKNTIILDLSCAKINDIIFKNINELTALKYINLTRCHLITDKGIEYLTKSNTLETIILNYCNLINDKAIEYIVKYKSLLLKNIEIDGCKLLTYKTFILLDKFNWKQIDEKYLQFESSIV